MEKYSLSPLLFRSGRTSETPPPPPPRLAERRPEFFEVDYDNLRTRM